MDEEKLKAEKLAAAKKRVEQMKKAKAKKASGSSSSSKKESDTSASASAPSDSKQQQAPTDSSSAAPSKEAAEPADEPTTTTTEKLVSEEDSHLTSPLQSPPLPSLSQQSKARSTSFRKASISASGGGPLSPGVLGPFSPGEGGGGGETAPEIYRKHVSRIEELERENKRLGKEAADAEKRWQRAEGELADLRDGEGGEGVGGDAEANGVVKKLKNEIAALQRQNAHLQSTTSVGHHHRTSPSISLSPGSAVSPPSSELEAQLQSKSSTIETMELEMSRLRAQVERLSVSASTPSEQITALEEKLARAEKAAALAQRELADLKRNLERTSEKAVKEGSGRASAETKLRTLERELAEIKGEREELAKKAEGLEKKVTTLTTLHREQDGRMQGVKREKEALEKEAGELRTRLDKAEGENLRLRKKDAAEGGGDDEGVDELEEEGRLRLERRVRELEAENSDLRRGIWHERRKEMQVGIDDMETVDLGGAGAGGKKGGQQGAGSGGGIGDFLASGLGVLTGSGGGGGGGGGGGDYHHHGQHGHHHGHGHDDDGGLLEDDDLEFDEEAFRLAQQEEQKKRIERIKEIKRGLKNWEGWRLDLVENRSGGGEGIGEIFEI